MKVHLKVGGCEIEVDGGADSVVAVANSVGRVLQGLRPSDVTYDVIAFGKALEAIEVAL